MRGNKYFKGKMYSKAVECYQEALALSGAESSLKGGDTTQGKTVRYTMFFFYFFGFGLIGPPFWLIVRIFFFNFLITSKKLLSAAREVSFFSDGIIPMQRISKRNEKR